MRRFALAVSLAGLTSACGSFNLNEMLVSKAQQEAIDGLVQEAQYEYDKGRYDNALGLTNKALAINPQSESPTILKSYVYLSKAGLDAINISKKLIVANEANKKPATGATATTSTVTKTGDTTTDNFNTLKTVLNLTPADFEVMGTKDTVGSGTTAQEIYYPKLVSEVRDGTSATINYLNDAVETLCPLILASANPDNDVDTRHTCTKNPLASAAKGRANFAWALAHLGEAISFYTVVLYDTNGDGIPNLQSAIPTGELTIANAGVFIDSLESVNKALNSIFPTDPLDAADSMLNALFSDLKTTSTALAAIPGIPSEVSDSIKRSITDLETKISSITTAGGAAGAQNEALKNSLTTGIATTLESRIESDEFSDLNTTDQRKACCVYRNMNTAAERPSNCSASFYSDSACAALLAE